MQNIKLLALLFLLPASLMGCNKEDDDDNNNKLPDAAFTANVSGAESHSFDFVLPMGTSGEYVINGALSSAVGLFTLNVLQLPIGWSIGLVSDMSSMATGVYDLKPGFASFANPSQTAVYMATAGTLTIDEADLFQNIGPSEDWYLSGSFSGTFQDNATPPNQVTISGTFQGINIKVN